MAGGPQSGLCRLDLTGLDEDVVRVERADREDGHARGREGRGKGRKDPDFLEREWTQELDDLPPSLRARRRRHECLRTRRSRSFVRRPGDRTEKGRGEVPNRAEEHQRGT